MDPAHVLWIGGATGAGKSSIAGTLAHRHDLQLYNVDHRTYIHVERARVPPDVRWDLPPSELAQRFLDDARDRFELVLEDLAELPARGCREVVELSLEDYLSVGADRSTSRPPRT